LSDAQTGSTICATIQTPCGPSTKQKLAEVPDKTFQKAISDLTGEPYTVEIDRAGVAVF